MSLLMDALKRAEESKQDAARAMTRSNRPGAPELSLEPVTGDNVPAELPELADHIEAVDAELAAASAEPARTRPPAFVTPPERPAPAPQIDASRDVARNVFAAKQPPAAPDRTMLWIGLGITGIAAIGIAVYFYFQLAALGSNSLAGRTTPPIAQQAAPAPAVATPPVRAPELEPAPTTPPTAVLLPPPERTAPSAPTSASTLDSPPAPAAVRIKRSPAAPDPDVSRGYAALRGDTLDQAQHAYEQALRKDAKNVDALLGLAAVAQRQGRQADAERLQQLAYEADPKDSAAQAAVVANATGDAVALESRLRNLLASQPESAPLNFALGNLLSRQNRWAEAQQAYFSAVAGDGDNPDFLFNLAVSLDHLRQPKLAAQHYRLALEAAERRPAAFDRIRVQKRLQELQP